MAGLIKGITVTLYAKTQTGEDDFGAPIYTETPITVDNVLVCPISTGANADTLDKDGARAEYELCIPKGDAHQWERCRVDFMGKSWRTFGFAQEWLDYAVPLAWNKKIKVERYE